MLSEAFQSQEMLCWRKEEQKRMKRGSKEGAPEWLTMYSTADSPSES